MSSRSIKIAFIGAQTAGIIGALTALAEGYCITSAVSYSEDCKQVLENQDIRTYQSINELDFQKALKESDLLLCVHGRELVGDQLLNYPRLGGINVHPFLSKYKGANPVARALKNKERQASVGVHVMTEKLDQGEVLFEEYCELKEVSTVSEIYNQLYPLYSSVISNVLKTITKEWIYDQETAMVS